MGHTHTDREGQVIENCQETTSEVQKLLDSSSTM